MIAALDLAEELDVPVEWFALSSGASIAMDSGTENMDWVAAALRRIVDFTQAGGEINVVVTGINVGAQPYWNAEATMLMHTKGILVMTPESAMVLTGKQALDYSGGVSAEDNLGIGGYERVMGPNGQAQYRAPDLAGACECCSPTTSTPTCAPGERFPRRADGRPARPRRRRLAARAPGSDLETVGEIFSEETNPGRKKPFDIRAVMRAVADADAAAGALGGHARGGDRRHVGRAPRRLAGGAAGHRVPAAVALRLDPGRRARAVDGGHAVPAVLEEGRARDQRRVRAAARSSCSPTSPGSTARPSRCAGCSSSTAPRSGARSSTSTGRSRSASSRASTAAPSSSSRARSTTTSRRSRSRARYASVIGGAPAAAVVFARDVDVRTREDERIAGARRADRDRRGRRAPAAARGARELWTEVRSEKLGELAAEFDAVHSVQRAVEVGSVDRVIPASALRADLIDTIERGMGAVAQPSSSRRNTATVSSNAWSVTSGS